MQSKPTPQHEAAITSLKQKLTDFWHSATENPNAEPDTFNPADIAALIIICVLLGTTIP